MFDSRPMWILLRHYTQKVKTIQVAKKNRKTCKIKNNKSWFMKKLPLITHQHIDYVGFELLEYPMQLLPLTVKWLQNEWLYYKKSYTQVDVNLQGCLWSVKTVRGAKNTSSMIFLLD